MFANLNVLIKTENIWFSLWNIVMVENSLTKYVPNLRLVFIILTTYNICIYKFFDENPDKEVDELKVATFMYQICAAMKYIHSRNVIHLDLKVISSLKTSRWKLTHGRGPTDGESALELV